jgi:threonine/homoserine efflux transporter RhtA
LSGKANLMNFNSFPIQPLIALIAGILILIQPRLLNYIVAIYLIIVGVIGLAPGFR